jgi:hypothetical protein
LFRFLSLLQLRFMQISSLDWQTPNLQLKWDIKSCFLKSYFYIFLKVFLCDVTFSLWAMQFSVRILAIVRFYICLALRILISEAIFSKIFDFFDIYFLLPVSTHIHSFFRPIQNGEVFHNWTFSTLGHHAISFIQRINNRRHFCGW